MWAWLWAQLVSKALGDGFGAEIAGRASVYLVDEARKAVDKEPEPVTGVRLRPGESFTVTARPAPTREQRKLAAAQRSLRERDRRLNRPSRRQLRAARSLRRRQRRLDRRHAGTRRYDRAAAKERAAGERFDRVMRPTRRQAAVRSELDAVTRRLDDSRSGSMAKVRARTGRGRRPHSQVYD
jgi:hypothetical protein